MKTNCMCVLLAGLMGIPALTLQAQDLSLVTRGNHFELKTEDGYSSYQWQVSSDKKFFVDIPEGNVQNFSYKVNAPGYFRVKVTDADHHVFYRDTIGVGLKELHFKDKYFISGGGHGYVEMVDGQVPASGITIPEDRVDGVAGTTQKLTSWVNGDAMAVYYFNHPASVIDTEMFLKVRGGANVAFRVKVTDPDRPDRIIADNILAFRGTGAEQKVTLVGSSFLKKKYYRYQIECLEGWKSIIEISKFHHHSMSSQPTYKAAFRSSPSVHLGKWHSTDPQAPQGNAYDWCYQEVKMPKEADIAGTYIMSLGVLSGYMGIQVNGYDEQGPVHGVLFSMWDDGSTDKDPNLPEYRRACALDHGEDVTVKRFGHEGTGIQSFKHGHYWSSDTYVQFVTHCQPETAYYYEEVNGELKRVEQHNTLVSAWYNAQDGKGWIYMATLRVPNRDQYFGSWYSFLENFNAATGQKLRKGFYRNGFARSVSQQKWFHCNSVKFGHTDGGTNLGARDDYAQGKSDEEPDAFFMETGGYHSHRQKASTMPLSKNHVAVDTINLAALIARENQAIEREKALIEEEELFIKNKINKEEWSVIDFSSEEAKGQGNNGRADLIIDGDDDTYWHSQWKGVQAKYPHHLTVDMNAEYEMRGMEILMSGGTKRYMKAFNVYASNDNKIWKKVYSETDAPDKDKFHFLLKEPVVARYFKLEITDGRATDGDHVRINEINVCGFPVETGISDITSQENVMEVFCRKNELSVSFRKDMSDLHIDLYTVDGACIFSECFDHLSYGETLYIPMHKVQNGVYILSCKAGAKQYVKQILRK